MNKAEKKFRLYAILVIFVLLTAMLAVINGINFTMAARDADKLTEMLATRQGTFENKSNISGGMQNKPRNKDFMMGPMGPASPEMNASLRYFTVSFSGKNGEIVAFNISAVTESEALEWALNLKKETAGWTRGTYRYRVYKNGDTTYVTVIDQGRELLPSYRILIISAVGEVLCLVAGWFVLLGIGRRIYAPIEEADRKQKNFIKNANKEFRLPLTIISGNTELIERKYGPDDETRSTRRQIMKLNELVNKLGTIGIFDDEQSGKNEISLSELLREALDRDAEKFFSKNLKLSTDISPDVKLTADEQAIKQMFDEIIGNTLKYALTKARFKLQSENGYIFFEVKNDANLADGLANQVFDRFTVLENADKENSVGLGLAYVKEIVKAHNGRISAEVADGIFILRITI